MRLVNRHTTKEDYHQYYNKKLPKGFTDWDALAAHNQEIVNRTIQEMTFRKKLKREQFYQDLGERVEACTAWLTSPLNTTMSIEDYLGPKNLAYLRAQQIMSVIQGKAQLIEKRHHVIKLSSRD